MDWEQSLKDLRKQADQGALAELHFTEEMAQNVRKRIAKRRGPLSGWSKSMAWAAAVCALVFAVVVGPDVSRFLLPNESGAVEESTHDWVPSPVQTGSHNGVHFEYVGEKPLRLMISEMYEDQGQKTMVLLDGDFTPGDQVEIIATSAQGKRVSLGKWTAGGALNDAASHFPTGLAFPDAGIWKVQAEKKGKLYGEVYIEVKPGIAPWNSSLAEPLIEEYVKTNKQFHWLGEKREVKLDYLGAVSYSADEKTIFAWATLTGEDPYGVRTAGISAPMKFTIQFVNDDYQVVSHQQPEDGNRYWASIQEIFPEKYWKRIENYRKPSEKPQ